MRGFIFSLCPLPLPLPSLLPWKRPCRLLSNMPHCICVTGAGRPGRPLGRDLLRSPALAVHEAVHLAEVVRQAQVVHAGGAQQHEQECCGWRQHLALAVAPTFGQHNVFRRVCSSWRRPAGVPTSNARVAGNSIFMWSDPVPHAGQAGELLTTPTRFSEALRSNNGGAALSSNRVLAVSTHFNPCRLVVSPQEATLRNRTACVKLNVQSREFRARKFQDLCSAGPGSPEELLASRVAEVSPLLLARRDELGISMRVANHLQNACTPPTSERK